MKSTAGWLIAAIYLSGCALAAPPPIPDWTEQKWDAIVIGAGTAGIIVADRLREGGKKTLLLEIGGPSYGITGGKERPAWLAKSSLSRVDVPGLCTCQSNIMVISRARALLLMLRHQTKAYLKGVKLFSALPGSSTAIKHAR